MRDASQFPRFSANEMASRHQRVSSIIEEQELDAIIFFGSGAFTTDIYWLTDWPGGRESYVIFQRDADPVVITQLFNHVPMARVLSVVEDVRWAGANTANTVCQFIGDCSLPAKRIGLVGPIPYRHYLLYAESHPEITFTDVSGPFRMMRTIKQPEEIARLQKASELTDKSISAVADGLKEGMREDEIPLLIESAYLEEGGYAGIHFMSSMPMNDPDFPVPAQFHSSRKLQQGDCLITEISGAWWGYSGQIHRTFSLGPPTDEWVKLHDVAVEGYLAIENTIKDGATTADVEEAADIIHDRGYNILDDLLHGVSQSPPIIQTKTTKRHESPDITFRENMAVTIQPNVMTMDEKMGLQFGETVIVTKTGCTRLNAYPREWIVCQG
ncbi:MAG: Xaa-Pro peptidase family protein [Pseudomonadota bacterium]|nr:Xaa-Pro peptidase family protein [Pseudomonadota bacterium]